MQIGKWMLALIALLACGLIAVGCGGDDEDSGSSSSSSDSSEESSDTSSDDSDSGSATEVDADAFLAECEDLYEGTPGAEIAQTGCQQAADALESCAEEAEAAGGDDEAVELAVEACQEIADEAVAALESASP